MQIRHTKSGDYLIRATYDPSTQKSPSRVIGKIAYGAVELHDGVTLTDAETAQIDAHLAPGKLQSATFPIRHLKGRLTEFLEALRAHPEAETPELLASHQALLREALKALRALARGRRKKARAHPPIDEATTLGLMDFEPMKVSLGEPKV